MSASPAAADHCPNCGLDLPPSARFCPACGVAIEAGETVESVLPPHQAGPSPATLQRAEPRWFGIAPPQLLLALAAAAFVAAIVLFATGHWPYALILLGVGALLLAAFLEAARRRPVRGLAQTPFDAKERARSSWETLRARQAVAAELRRIQSGLALLERDRRAAFHDLGAATHLHDAAAEAAVRARLVELDRHEAALRQALAQAQAEAGERIRRARLPVQETMMVLPSEPAPPPGEATPPQPAQVPEPYPPPDEGTPPQPARIPEPSPDPDPGRED
jgi:hypothetical protein